ncbi:MAG TPA: hypothetical protein VMS01_04140 [Stellaceae bacterium]|nr:hypothetical protein [Stellaceae bacterium]
MKFPRLFLAATLFAGAAMPAFAGSLVSGDLHIVVTPPALGLVLPNGTLQCPVPGGTVVATVSTFGGDGTAVTYSMGAGSTGTDDLTDFVIGPATGVVSVAAAGLTTSSPMCAPGAGTHIVNGITASQN